VLFFAPPILEAFVLAGCLFLEPPPPPREIPGRRGTPPTPPRRFAFLALTQPSFFLLSFFGRSFFFLFVPETPFSFQPRFPLWNSFSFSYNLRDQAVAGYYPPLEIFRFPLFFFFSCNGTFFVCSSELLFPTRMFKDKAPLSLYPSFIDVFFFETRINSLFLSSIAACSSLWIALTLKPPPPPLI